ncbi:MAG: hypothetical protein ACFE85_18055 [Candidatus Hodarchaeota archaeon]
MPRELTPNRWNWSQKDGKWVYIELTDDGQTNYYYQLEPPKEFMHLTMKIKVLNEKLITCHNIEENDKIFNEMMKISKKMQCMNRNY